jgi:alpha-tubulin suppressor-like RCC1 family protein
MWWMLWVAGAAPIDVSLSGRVFDASGRPVDGVHDVTVDFLNASDGVVGTRLVDDAPVQLGVFHVRVPVETSWFRDDLRVRFTVGGVVTAPEPVAATPRAGLAREGQGIPALAGVVGTACPAEGWIGWDTSAQSLVVCPATGSWTAISNGPSFATPEYQFAIGATHACAVDAANGTLYCWGDASVGQIPGITQSSPVPRRIDLGGPVSSVDVVEQGTCAVVDGAVWCWGRSWAGSLGQNVPHGTVIPPTVVPGITDAVSVAAGEHHACALRSDGTVSCWGNNNLAQLGRGSNVPEWTPTPAPTMSLTGVVQLEASAAMTCARTAAGDVYCWGGGGGAWRGSNSDTCGSTSCANRPRQVNLSGGAATDIATGNEHALALVEGHTQCWGVTTHTNFGTNAGACGNSNQVLVHAILPPFDIVDVEAGYGHSCVRNTTGTIYCFGNAANGRLGTNTTSGMQATPTALTVPTGADELWTGNASSCARVGATFYCWGNNTNGLVGAHATGATAATAVTFPGLP